MIIDLEHIQNSEVEHDGIVFTLSKGDTVHLLMTKEERQTLKERLEHEDPDTPKVNSNA
jgi:hypothetical protein